MAKGELVASVIFQELLEELVLPHCKSVDKIRIFSNMLWSECDCIKRETSSYQVVIWFWFKVLVVFC